ncbi:SRPBCC domain-containing protein [Paenibacillus sp. NFR01]|uniref:SRPBCC domain-containing protein n=1 Tax=Paenibacillus sp. NFR01 TaxID=1566279 RepID=UPI0008B575BA|nr:SRPBCC domain-containing protein [Paenibacillus sp. NFR01]SET31127.1 Uncharacterized conserved protein YndB, AHSA1/START domain [Paenibacillus sp. NFR01]
MSENTVFRTEGQELVMERVFHAPRELVFQAFTQAEHLKHWWGPQGWELPYCTVDLQPGGVWHYCMKCVDPAQGDFYGMESWGKAVYETIEAPEKLGYTDYFSDAEGTVNEELPSAKNELTFVEENGNTRLISVTRYTSAEELAKVLEMGMEQGIKETWDRAETYLQTLK